MKKNRIGIFGGSFDPIHTGHLIIADYTREEYDLDKIIFIPAFRSPHKEQSKFTSPDQRLEMIRMSIKDNPYFEISDHEIKSSKAVYTIDTIKYLKDEYPNSKLFMLIGADLFNTFHKWKDPELIKKSVMLIVASREKYQTDPNVTISSAPLINISSTLIRDRVKKKLSIKYLVNSNVEHYINNNKLYK